MSDNQTEQLICGKSQLPAPKASTEVLQRSATCTNLLNSSSPSITCQSAHPPNRDSGLSTVRVLMHLPMLWGSRLAMARNRQSNPTATASKSTSEASSQDEEAVLAQGKIDTPLPGKIQDSPPKNVSQGTVREYHDVLDLCSPESWSGWDREWDRDVDGGAVVDVDMLCMRALVDGVHIIYL
jgi:hypothetical protein